MSFLRYPGGKTKLRNQIVGKLKKLIGVEYREPFFGGGSIGLRLLEERNFERVWFNDWDSGIVNLWTAVIQYPESLKQLVLNFEPSVSKFHEFKVELLSGVVKDAIEHGFKKLAIHQISYSGLGTMSGGPQGGEKQASKYKIDCRWSPTHICKKIDAIHMLLAKAKACCSHCDFSSLIEAKGDGVIIYLDPPYFEKGNDLYQHGFNLNDHQRLADSLKKTKHQWLLSYDDCEEIRELYEWADIEAIDNVNYSITALKDKDTGKRTSRSKVELLIYPKNSQIKKETLDLGQYKVCKTTSI